MNIRLLNAKESPHKFFFKLSDHSFQQAYFSRHFLTIIAIASFVDNFRYSLFQLLFSLDVPYFNKVSYDAMSKCALTLYFITGSHMNQIMI